MTEHRPEASFACPRCGDDVSQRFYGPCRSCRSDLRQRLAADARHVAVGAFEPAMHVTPNAVASKE